MLRPLLRVKTGCLRCRKRRIKCGEEKPICKNCRRWSFQCTWPHDIQRMQRQSNPELASELMYQSAQTTLSLTTYQTHLMTNGIEKFQDETQLLLVKDAIRFLGMYPFCPSKWQVPAFCMTLVMQFPGVRSAAAAFSTSVMARSHQQLKPRALKTYLEALNSSRSYISCFSHNHDDICIATSALFLGLTEVFGHYQQDHAVLHLSIVARRAHTYQQKFLDRDADTEDKWMRQIIDLALYLYSTLSILDCGRALTLSEQDWQYLKAFLLLHGAEQSLNVPACTSTLHSHLNRTTWLKLYISHLARTGKLSAEFKDGVKNTFTDLDAFQNDNDAANCTDVPEIAQQSMRLCFRMQYNIFRISLIAISEPNLCSSHLMLRQLVEKVTKDHFEEEETLVNLTKWIRAALHQQLYPFPDLRVDANLCILWAALAPICAAHEMAELDDAVRITLPRLGMVDRELKSKLSRLVLIIKERKRQNLPCRHQDGQSCNTRHDGLDILFHFQQYVRNV